MAALERRYRLILGLAVLGALLVSYHVMHAGEGQPPVTAGAARWFADLRAGENYLAPPLVPTGTTFDELFGPAAQQLDEVALWDGAAGDWLRWHPDRAETVPALGTGPYVFRVLARCPVRLFFEGTEFDASPTVDDRLVFASTWTFIGAWWNDGEASSVQNPDDFLAKLRADGFVVGTDVLRRWDGLDQSWHAVPAAADLPNPVPRGTVFAACPSTAVGDEPYRPSATSPTVQAKSTSGSGTSGSTYTPPALTTYAKDGTTILPSNTLGDVTISDHTYSEDATGNPQLGSCYVHVPASLRALTDLPAKLAASVSYTNEATPKVKLLTVDLTGLSSIVAGNGMPGQRTLASLDKFLVTPSGVFFATGTLTERAYQVYAPSEPSQPADTTTALLQAQMVLRTNWVDMVSDADDVDAEGPERPTVEVQVPLGSRAVAAVRWCLLPGNTVTAANADGTGANGWILYLTKGGDEVTLEVPTAAAVLGPGRPAKLALRASDDASDPRPVPLWFVDDVKNVKTALNPLWPLYDEDNPATLEGYESGLLRFALTEDWRCDFLGRTADYVLRLDDHDNELHLSYRFETTTDRVSTTATLVPSLFFNIKDFDLGECHFDYVMVGLRVRAALSILGTKPGDNPLKRKMLAGLFRQDLTGGSSSNTSWRDKFRNAASSMTSGSSAGFGLFGTARFAPPDFDASITSLVTLDFDWTWADRGTNAADARARYFKRTFLFQTSVRPQADVVDGAATEDGQAYGARVAITWDDNPRRPNRRIKYDFFGDFTLPSAWGLVTAPGDKPSLSGLLSMTFDKFDAGRGPGGQAGTARRFEFGLTSDFAFDLGGDATGVEMPDLGDGTKPSVPNSLAVDNFRLTLTSKTFGAALPKREFTLELSGVAQTVVGSTPSTISFFLGARSTWEANESFKDKLKKTDFLLSFTFDMPFIDGDYCRMDELFLARQWRDDLQTGQWAAGLSLLVRTGKTRPWGKVSFLPVFATGGNWRVTGAVSDLEVSDEFTLKSAFLSFGKTNGLWDNALGGSLLFPDLDILNDFQLQIDALARWSNGSPSFKLYARDVSSTPQFGDDSSKVTFSLKELGGELSFVKNTAQGGGQQPDVMSLYGAFEIGLPVLKPNNADADYPTPKLAASMQYIKNFTAARAGNASTTFSIRCDTSTLAYFPLEKGKTLQEAGGFALNAFEITHGPAGFIAEGLAEAYFPKTWRDTVGSIGGSGVGLALPENADASVRWVIGPKNGPRGPLEVSVDFSGQEDNQLGIRIGELATIGVKRLYFRRASPWAVSADAAVSFGSGSDKKEIEGNLSQGTNGVFMFAPNLKDKPLSIDFGDLTLDMTNFLVTFAPRTPERPMSFSIAGAITGRFGEETISGSATVSVAGDGSFMVSLALDDGGSISIPGVDSARFTLLITRNPEGSEKKFKVVVAVTGEFTIPDGVPLLGGRTLMGTVLGSSDGDFLFSMATDPVIELPMPFTYDGQSVAVLKFQALTIGRQNGGFTIAGTAGLDLYQPLAPFFGGSETRPASLPLVSIGLDGANFYIQFPATAMPLIPTVPGTGTPGAVTPTPTPTPTSTAGGTTGGEPALSFSLGIPSFGDFAMHLDYLRFSTLPAVSCKGGCSFTPRSPMPSWLSFGVEFTVNYNPITNAFSFLFLFDPEFKYLTSSGLFSLRKFGYSQILPGLSGWDADFDLSAETILFGFFFHVDNLWYMDPSRVPPVGFAFFDEFQARLTILGFSASASIALPKPRLPNPLTIITFFQKLTDAFQNGQNASAWNGLQTWLEENEQEFNQIFPGPGLGKIHFLMPYVLHEILPDCPVVEQVIWPIPEVKCKRVKLVLTDKMWFAADLLREAGLGWPKLLVTQLKIVWALTKICQGEMSKVINLVPEDKRSGEFGFAIPGFASFLVGYDVIPDYEVQTSELVDGVVEFQRFNRMAMHLESMAPPLEDVASGDATPMTTNFAFTDGEGERFEGTLKDTHVNLQAVMERAIALRDRFVPGDEVVFDERESFRRHMTYLGVTKRAAFTAAADRPVLEAAYDGRRSELRLVGNSAPITFAGPDGTEYITERPFPFYATYSSTRRVTGEEVSIIGIRQDLTNREKAAREAVQAAVAAADAKKGEIATFDGRITSLTAEVEKAQADLAAWWATIPEEFRGEGGGKALLKQQREYDIQGIKTRVDNFTNKVEELRKDLTALEQKADKLAAEADNLSTAKQKADSLAAAVEKDAANLRKVVIENHVEEKNGKLVLVFDATLRDYRSDSVIHRAEIPDQVVYDMTHHRFDDNVPVVHVQDRGPAHQRHVPVRRRQTQPGPRRPSLHRAPARLLGRCLAVPAGQQVVVRRPSVRVDARTAAHPGRCRGVPLQARRDPRRCRSERSLRRGAAARGRGLQPRSRDPVG